MTAPPHIPLPRPQFSGKYLYRMFNFVYDYKANPTFHMTNQEKVPFTLYYMHKSKGIALAFLQMCSLIHGNSILI